MRKRLETVNNNKNDNTVFPNIYSMDEVKYEYEHHHKDTDYKKIVNPKTDIPHQSTNHKPRQLPGRHH